MLAVTRFSAKEYRKVHPAYFGYITKLCPNNGGLGAPPWSPEFPLMLSVVIYALSAATVQSGLQAAAAHQQSSRRLSTELRFARTNGAVFFWPLDIRFLAYRLRQLKHVFIFPHTFSGRQLSYSERFSGGYAPRGSIFLVLASVYDND